MINAQDFHFQKIGRSWNFQTFQKSLYQGPKKSYMTNLRAFNILLPQFPFQNGHFLRKNRQKARSRNMLPRFSLKKVSDGKIELRASKRKKID